MASSISAGNATNGLAISSDNTGILELKSGAGAGTAAITVDASQNATFAAAVSIGTIKSTTTSPPTIQNSSGTEIGTLCRAWVNFAGANGAINAAFNVSSVTRSAIGVYAVTFSSAMPDANYSTVATAPSYTVSNNAVFASVYNSTSTVGNPNKSAGSVSVTYRNAAASGVNGYDPVEFYVAVFR